MRITELLTKNTIHLHLKSSQKAEVIEELVQVLDVAGKLNDRAEYKQAIFHREEQSTTGIGEGIAIPHAKTAAVKAPAIVFGRSVSGIEYESLDGMPAHLFFMIAAPEGANDTHLQALSKLSTILLKEEVRKQLLEAQTEEEALAIINEHDVQEEEEAAVSVAENEPFVVAVTACPTGIAHTYMSADSLKAKAEEMGIAIKVETNGSGGAKNVLTSEEIERATAVIVAADTQVQMARFNGKHVIEVPVAEGIRKPQELIERALKQEAPIFKDSSNKDDHGHKESASRGIGATIYKHLMSGVSNMLPFVIGGGILIALGFLFGYNAHDPNDPSYNIIAEALNTIGGGNAFALMVPVLAGFIAMSIADRPGFAPGMVGGMMAATSGAGFLGGLVAGFLGGYIVVGIRKLLAGLPSSLEGIKTILLFPLLGIAITGFIMHFVVNTPLSALNTWISNWLSSLGTANAVLLGVILGLMMAIDMGGPINKAAYLFGTGLIASGVYEPMAAIMAGGMVPPLGIALATFLFKNKFSKQEREAGPVNIVMGLSFITEGAIPFAAADPLRVIPSVAVGAAVAGGLSMMFNIGLQAPHGGIFVFPLVSGSWLLYLLAVIIGAIVSAILLGLLKKPVK
ncbi:PTS fructose transporter subunit IIABC [Lederbergia galactosidilytica]|uniref:PTS fructose transporter subunit IIA n=1 Tax=Lederbergia galactosidilytica TaxID=217031 RepID=A0A177ZHA4_9BACI|nr:PTS fructose transporter subunit IIABC [Lederbergia galactosidilytica]KRG16472.1 PTS fructose transporter subunit IIA [Virgibacillus soli]OAK67347.1 PTS fructose transporter subunit IIA [Lederbergia galactosidilytica]